jgi:hypothetical protein
VLKRFIAWIKSRRERKSATADNKKYWGALDNFSRVMAWDYCNPYKWHNTDLYCPEHDGPLLPNNKKEDLASRRREFLLTGNKDLLIDQRRRRELDAMENNVERKFRERMRDHED